jgi:hypothetical protein
MADYYFNIYEFTKDAPISDNLALALGKPASYLHIMVLEGDVEVRVNAGNWISLSSAGKNDELEIKSKDAEYSLWMDNFEMRTGSSTPVRVWVFAR